MAKPTIAIVGASSDRSKYGNIAIHSYREAGYEVFPIHPKETEIEGLKVCKSVLEIPVPLDRVSVYLPPQTAKKVIEEIAKKGAKELFLNPGSESDALVAKARSLGLNVIVACSITAIKRPKGVRPLSRPLSPRCFFCGEELKAGGRQGGFRCERCRAIFRAQTDPEGCVIGLAVEECGAEECCRHRPGNRSS